MADPNGNCEGRSGVLRRNVIGVTNDALAEELQGIGDGDSDLTTLKHVRARSEIEAAEEIANRKPCADFEEFRPLFDQVQSDLKNGVRQAFPFNKEIGKNIDARVLVGDFYVLGGQFAYVAEMGEHEKTPEGAPQARLRVIFGNGTESDLLLRSLQAALYKDEAGRRLTKPNAGKVSHTRVRDRDIRTVLLARIEAEHGGDAETKVVPEMGINAGATRLDLAVINGTLHGYEIKSAADTLTRLPTQSTAYSRACDRVTIVASPNHLDGIRAIVPAWWGILTAVVHAGAVRLCEERVGKCNPKLDAYSVAQLLWRNEALELLEEHGLASGFRSKPRKELWRALADRLPINILGESVRTTIRLRQDWRPDPRVSWPSCPFSTLGNVFVVVSGYAPLDESVEEVPGE